jgi:hypothetical protein
MDREKEIAKLVNVLRRTARMAMQSAGTGEEAAAFCVEQFNRVLARLQEIDPGVGAVFKSLAAGSSLTVAAMACRQLAAYYEDEVGGASNQAYAFGFDTGVFKDFWCKAAREIEDFGEFIRESVEEWARHRRESGSKESRDESRAES